MFAGKKSEIFSSKENVGEWSKTFEKRWIEKFKAEVILRIPLKICHSHILKIIKV